MSAAFHDRLPRLAKVESSRVPRLGGMHVQEVRRLSQAMSIV
jgi:hypothetical protein